MRRVILLLALLPGTAGAGTTCAPDSALGCITVDDVSTHGSEQPRGREPAKREPPCDEACRRDRYERRSAALSRMEHIRPPEPIVAEPDREAEAYEDLNRGYLLLASAAVPGLPWPPVELAHAPPRPREETVERAGRDTGRCTEAQHDTLQSDVDKQCKDSEQVCRGPRNDELNDCDALRALHRKDREALRQKQRCLKARQRIRNQCFPEPRPEVQGDQEAWEDHRKQSEGILNGIKNCKARIALIDERLDELGCR